MTEFWLFINKESQNYKTCKTHYWWYVFFCLSSHHSKVISGHSPINVVCLPGIEPGTSRLQVHHEAQYATTDSLLIYDPKSGHVYFVSGKMTPSVNPLYILYRMYTARIIGTCKFGMPGKIMLAIVSSCINFTVFSFLISNNKIIC